MLLSGALAGPLLGPGGTPTGREIAASTVFSPAAPGWGAAVVGDVGALAEVATSSAQWLRASRGVLPSATAGLPAELGIDVDRTLSTLDRIAEIVQQDAVSGANRLQDPAFVEANFELYWWAPDAVGQQAAGLKVNTERIRLTRYYVTQVEGRAAAEGRWNTALYADPGPEARVRFTRPEVVGGAWAAGGAQPLVWLTEADVYEAQLQGTVEVLFPDGHRARFNVHQHNGRPWKRGASRASQPRYWYFRAVDDVLGWGEPDGCEACGKIVLKPNVAVAGDVWNLGPGRLIWVEATDGPRLVVLADSGGAFAANLFQLDWYGGAFSSPDALYAATKAIPGRVRAGFLVAKPLAVPEVVAPSER